MHGSQSRKSPVKILHTADIHLGDELEPELAERGFLAALDRALAERVDLLIIAGDLFDGQRAARVYFHLVLERLATFPIPVVLLPGNHDPCDGQSVYTPESPLGLCPNVHLIIHPDGELLDFPSLDLRIWGRPVVEHSPEFRPLAGIPRRRDDLWNVAVAHGLHVEDGNDSVSSSLIPTEEVSAAGWDYLALGHVHPYRDVSRPGAAACYSGSPAAFKSVGSGAGRVALVELDECNGVRVTPLALRPSHA